MVDAATLAFHPTRSEALATHRNPRPGVPAGFRAETIARPVGRDDDALTFCWGSDARASEGCAEPGGVRSRRLRADVESMSNVEQRQRALSAQPAAGRQEFALPLPSMFSSQKWVPLFGEHACTVRLRTRVSGGPFRNDSGEGSGLPVRPARTSAPPRLIRPATAGDAKPAIPSGPRCLAKPLGRMEREGG